MGFHDEDRRHSHHAASRSLHESHDQLQWRLQPVRQQNIPDSLSWTRGEHALKFGAQFRFNGGPNGAPIDVIPHVYGGAGDVPVRGIDTIRGMLPANITLAQNVLLSLSGSIERIQQRFETR